MAEQLASLLILVFYGYMAAGAAFALLFGWRGVGKIDQQAKGASLGFRILILPGCVALWPLLLSRWLHATGEPREERNPHR